MNKKNLLQPSGTKQPNEVRRKLDWFNYYEKHGRNARLTCRYFGISPDTFYRWKRRYNPDNLSLLRDDKKNRRPKNLREPTTPPAIINRVKELRQRYPTWGKNKLFILLKNEGMFVSVTTIGRVINRLKNLGLLHKPIIKTNSHKREICSTHHVYKVSTGSCKEYTSARNVWKK